MEPKSAGCYFGEPIRLDNTDHISAVKPNNQRHPAYRRLRYFYEQEFLPAARPTREEAESGGVRIANNQGIAVGGDFNTGGGDVLLGGEASREKTATTPIATAETRGVEFILQGCAPNGAEVTCSLEAVSTSGDAKLLIKGTSRYGYFADVQSTLFDQQGHEYALGEAQIADVIYTPKYRKGFSTVNRKHGRDISKQLLQAVPASIKVSFDDASSSVESIAKLTIGGAIDEEPFMVSFPPMELAPE